VVVFISQSYAKSRWTELERRAAQAAAQQRQRPYILPILLDDTDISTFLSTTAYFDWSQHGAVRIAEAILKRLGRMINDKDDAELLRIPEGEFKMGSDEEPTDRTPTHKIWLDSFYIYKNPVTYGQYAKFCEAIGRNINQLRSVMEDLKPSEDHPIVGVDW